MMLSATCFVTVGILVRWVGSDLPAGEAAFIRYAFGILLMYPALRQVFLAFNPFNVRNTKIRAFWVRGFFHVLAVVLWFYAMQRIPIAEVTAIGYTSPLWVVIGAALFLGETIKARRLAALLVGIIGALIILRPGFQSVGLGQLAQFIAAPLFAVSSIQSKLFTRDFSSAHIVAMLTLTCTVFLAPFALIDWVWPSWQDLVLLALTAVAATMGHFAMTAAFRAAPITVTQPVNVLQLVLASFAGVLLFADPLDPFVLLGGAVVVASVSYITYREHQLEKRARQDAGG